MSDSFASEAERRLRLAPGAFPFTSRFLEVEGARIHYVDEGDGPTLLMLHGNPSWSYLYRNVILALRPRFRCIAVDLAGFGLSTPPLGFLFEPEDHARVTAALIEALDLRDATLVGHDWGGPIGIAAARATRDRITRLCLGNTWAWPLDGDFHFEWFSRLLGGRFGRYLAERHCVFINFVLPSSMRRRKIREEELQAFRAPFQGLQARRAMQIFPRALTGAARPRELRRRIPGTGPGHMARWRHRLPRQGTRALANATSASGCDADSQMRPLPRAGGAGGSRRRDPRLRDALKRDFPRARSWIKSSAPPAPEAPCPPAPKT